jgi:hypothetical protein
LFKKLNIFIVSIMISTSVFSSWQVRQTKINHVQAGNANYFQMTVSGDVASASGCTHMSTGKQWVGFSLAEMNERKKILISLALAAQASGQLVDVGSEVDGCNSAGIADLQFIRVGDYLK